MRLSRSLASATVAVCLVLSLPYDALPHTRVEVRQAAAPEPFGAECRSSVTGSRVTAYCHTRIRGPTGSACTSSATAGGTSTATGPRSRPDPRDGAADRPLLERSPLVWVSHRKAR